MQYPMHSTAVRSTALPSVASPSVAWPSTTVLFAALQPVAVPSRTRFLSLSFFPAGWSLIAVCLLSAWLIVLLGVSTGNAHAQALRPTTASAPRPAVNELTTDDVVRLETKVVSLNVTVSDKQGNLVTGLPASAFRVFEDKVAQEVSFFTETDAPLALAVIFDLSHSMRPEKLKRARLALARLVESSHARDEFTLIPFNDKPWVAAEQVRDGEGVLRVMNSLRAAGNTALYDAVELGLQRLARQRQPGQVQRKALIIISDGEDNASRANFRRVRQLAMESDAAIYAISIRELAKLNTQGDALLDQLASATGGKAYFPHSPEATDEAFDQLAVTLRQQYSLAYLPSNFVADGKLRQIKVTVEPPAGVNKISVRHRSGYYATSDGRRNDTLAEEND